MKRSGFTMIELIFVIVIIGILAATALPKFNGVRDRAKVNSELSALSGLDGSITAVKEFRASDYNDDNISWNESGLANEKGTGNDQKAKYTSINSAKKVLKKVAKKAGNLKIVGLFNSDGNDVNATGDTTPYKDSILILKGPASNAQYGVTADPALPGHDAQGKPDKNDVWVFNPNNWDVNITGTNLYTSPTVIPAQSIGIVDVNDTTSLSGTSLQAERSDSSVGPKDYTPVN